jgi:hypothetical protein
MKRILFILIIGLSLSLSIFARETKYIPYSNELTYVQYAKKLTIDYHNKIINLRNVDTVFHFNNYNIVYFDRNWVITFDAKDDKNNNVKIILACTEKENYIELFLKDKTVKYII